MIGRPTANRIRSASFRRSAACPEIVVAGVLVAMSVAGCSELPTGPADASRMPIKGITLADWTADGYSTRGAMSAVDRIAAVGADMLPVLVTAYQTNTRADEIRADDARTPTPAAVADIVLKAKSLTTPLGVSLKLHVDVDSGEWRGHIQPSDAARWFSSYRAFVVPWAILAESLGIEQFVVGTELAGTLDEENRWRALIADIRGLFSGELIYAASWDEASDVPFWDAVDAVGVNFYAPVTFRKNPHRFEILRGWQPWLERIRLLHKLADRDIILTEIGYRSVDGAGMHPYDFQSDATLDLDEQADLYWAALQAVGNTPWIRGVYWWNWRVDGAGIGALHDYTPQDKPAERELNDAWR